MTSPSSPLGSIASILSQLGAQLRDAQTDVTVLEQALASARDIEQLALDLGHPLLAGASICLQQRVQRFMVEPDPASELETLSTAWSAHASRLLLPVSDPALDAAWNALQPHLAVAFSEEESPTEAPPPTDEVSLPAIPVIDEGEAAADCAAFLDSMQDTADSTAMASRPAQPVAAEPATIAPRRPPALPEPEPEEVPPEILEAFAQESREAFEAIERSIMSWERDAGLIEELRNVYRLTHSVKGAANSVGLRSAGTVLHRLEDTLEVLVEGRGSISTSALSRVTLGIVDALRLALADGSSATAAWSVTANRLIADIAALGLVPATETPPSPAGEDRPAGPREPAQGPPAAHRPPAANSPEKAPAKKTGASDRGTIRVEVGHLDSLMNLVGDLLVNRHRLNQKLGQVTALRSELGRARERLLHVVGDFNTRHEFSLRKRPAAAASDGFSELELDRYDDFNIVSRQLVEIAADTEEVIAQIDRQFGSFSEETGQFSTITHELQEQVARTRMVPLEQLFHRLQRAVRDAAESEGKPVAYSTEGAENRVDKVIIDQLFTPLLHIVRNAVAHGIEGAAERHAAGKPTAGRVHVASRTEAGRLVLEISDDGGGLRRSAIVETARRRGLLALDAEPSDAELAELIFQPGFTTARETTDVSGRGVGLDVVRRDLARLGGSVSVVGATGQGSTFIFTLPLTLVINQVMFVRCGSRRYALPINFVERVVEAPASALAKSGDAEMLVLGDHETIPVIRLRSRLGLETAGSSATAIILNLAERRTALLVDQIQSKIDIVVKPLGALLSRHPLFSGATLAGDGSVIFILDVPNLISPKGAVAPSAAAPAPEQAEMTSTHRILVADDSLSIRRIAANYLSQAGWEVETAVDGSEALEKLRHHPCSVVVSDLEMPRVNGFELLAEMRRNPSLDEIPVIILTSRDAAKHRDRASELGADDYLIKPVTKDQLVSAVSALLERRLVRD